MANIACVGDPSDHGGTIIDSGGSVNMRVGGIPIAVNGAMHSCPIEGHGVTAITAITTDSRNAGKNMLTTGAVAGCGATIIAPDRNVDVE